MKRILSALFILLIIFSLSAFAESGDNLIANGDFSALDASGMPSDWIADMWNKDTGISTLYTEADGYEGNAAGITNFGENDARFKQTIAVEPDTIYRFSCKAAAVNCGENGYGASISFENTYSYSDILYDTAGDWTDIVVYGKTGEDQTELTVMLRLGGYSQINTGTALFDNIEMLEVESAPSGAVILDLSDAFSNTSDTVTQDVTDENTDPARNTEAYLLLICLYAIGILAVARKNSRLSLTHKGILRLLIGGMIAAFALRVILAMRVRGYNTDINCFTAWSERVFAKGPGYFYSPDYFCDYPPGYMLMLWLVGAFRSVLNLGTQSSAYLVLLKMYPILFDLASSCLLYRFALRKKASEKTAFLLAMFYALNPAVFIDSAAWGQIDSVFTFFIVLCAIKADDDRLIAALLSFAAAVLIKPQAMLFAPIGLFSIIVSLCKAPSVRCFAKAGAAVLSAILLIYFTALVFCIGSPDTSGSVLLRPVSWIISLYSGTMTSYGYITINTLNLYTLFNLNWKPLTQVPALTVFAWSMFGMAYLYSAFLCIRSKSKKRLPLCGAVLIILIFTFGPMIHERYVFPAILLLAVAYAVDRDRRLLCSLVILTCTTALNEILVLQGGMTTANYGHLHSSEQWLNAILSLTNVLNALYMIYVSLDICLLDHVHTLSIPDDYDIIPEKAKETDHRLHLKTKDIMIILGVTALYAVVAFTNLGSLKAPQTSWTSTQPGETVTFDLQNTQTFRMVNYGGICDSTFTVELSNDGENWTEPCYAQYDQGEIFRWIYYVPMDENLTKLYEATIPTEDGSAYTTYASTDDAYPYQTARYVRISAQKVGLTLSEFGFWSESGELLSVDVSEHTGAAAENAGDPYMLIDEQDTVASTPSYFNSTYFDEIYHARTAYELVHGMYVYEWTHPPLGKVVMSLGIRIFGMTPFGWRFMGTVAGVLMLPLMYLMVRQLTKSGRLSLIAMLLLAFDSMHFTQTRIATIDSFSVFWIMLEYFLMFRYIQMDWKKVPISRTFITLGACGLAMGAACATKWIGCYSAIGLAVLLFWKIIREFIHWDKRDRSACYRKILVTVLFCCVFFVVVPVLIYYFSYYGQLRYEGVATVKDMFSKRWIKRVIELQQSMLRYHSGLSGDTHYFRSPWYQWPVIWWPMWYYSGTAYMPDGYVSSISCMGNPAVWWFGLISLIFILIMSAWKRKAQRTWIIVLIGFASQFLPWVLVPRSTFIYHYFASVPFIIICSVLLLGELRKHSRAGFKIASITLLAAALVLFAAFYPLESGLPAARGYVKYLRWFKWYNY